MIIEEKLENGLAKHYSSDGKKIHQINDTSPMDYAIDVYPCPYEYVEFESDPADSDYAEIDKVEAFDILVGEE